MYLKGFSCLQYTRPTDTTYNTNTRVKPILKSWLVT